MTILVVISLCAIYFVSMMHPLAGACVVWIGYLLLMRGGTTMDKALSILIFFSLLFIAGSCDYIERRREKSNKQIIEKLKDFNEFKDKLNSLENAKREITGEVEDAKRKITGEVEDAKGEITGKVEDAKRVIEDAERKITGKVEDAKRDISFDLGYISDKLEGDS